MIKKPEGTYDVLPDEAKFWEIFCKKARGTFANFGYKEIITPIFENTNLFERGIGNSTDVVNKEMFKALSGGNIEKLKAGERLRSSANLSLRPEGTAGVIRSIIENGLVQNNPGVLKLAYAGPMFRAERPQKGRFRQFMQVGVECVGSYSPTIDAEAIIMLMMFYKSIGFDMHDDDITLFLNSIGCMDCRSEYKKVLVKYLNKHKSEMCKSCIERININPLRVLDCKEELCQEVINNAPTIDNYLCDDCKQHFESVKNYLNKSSIKYKLDSRLVRGLDYYTRTVFEVRASGLGSQDSIAGGGRYDGLMSELGGGDVPGFGFALGYERTLLALQSTGFKFEPNCVVKYYVACVDESCRDKCFSIAQTLRENKVSCEIDHLNKSLKAQLKIANKLGCEHVFIVGPDELKQGKVTARNMKSHEQNLIDIDKIFSYVAGF